MAERHGRNHRWRSRRIYRILMPGRVVEVAGPFSDPAKLVISGRQREKGEESVGDNGVGEIEVGKERREIGLGVDEEGSESSRVKL
ncbi:hypothetical protein PIB30_086917 [Stylosanthes scabra]|uniref:Uncharacterized protein n=1 Tax=Stylosanthes scabra TaxID=79078 RepID=A0ABU6QVM0_9FABA|nr:hypothetical protein [Stylosanthes scabra]